MENIPLVDWLLLCINRTEHCYSEAGAAKYIQITDSYIKNYFKDSLLEDVTENMLQDFFDSLGEVGKNLSRQTIHLIYSVLNNGLKTAEGCGLIRYNPCMLAYIRRRLYGNNTVLSDEAIRSILQKKIRNEYENLFPILLISTARYGEAAALSWSDIDPIRKCICIRKHLITYYNKGHVNYKIADLTKNHGTRIVYLPSFTFGYFDDERKLQQEKIKQAQNRWSNPHNLVFTAEDGSPLHHYKVMRRFKKIVTPLGQPHANIHTLRHTGSTVCFLATRKISSVQAMTGNSGMGSAAYYVHYLEQKEKHA